MSPKSKMGNCNSEICIAVSSFEVSEESKSPNTSKSKPARLLHNNTKKKHWRTRIKKIEKSLSENSRFRLVDNTLRRKWFGCNRRKRETSQQVPQNGQRENDSRNWNQPPSQSPHRGDNELQIDNQYQIDIAESNSVSPCGVNFSPQMVQNTSQQHVLVNPSHDQMLSQQMEVSATPTYILPMNWPAYYQSWNGNNNMQIAIANNPMIQQVNAVNEQTAIPDVNLHLNTRMVIENPRMRKQSASYIYSGAESLAANNPMSEKIQPTLLQSLQRKVVSDLIQPHGQNLKVAEHTPMMGYFALFKPDYYSYVRHIKNLINHEVLWVWYQNILLHCPWFNLPSSQKNIRRLVYWLTNSGCSCKYHSSGAVLTPVPIPEWLVEISRVLMKTTGFDSFLSTPNACNINFYRNGMDFVGWGADDQDMFGDLDGSCKVLSLSLGRSRTLQLRQKNGNNLDITSITLDHGDIITMEGLLQRYYDNRVPKSIYETGAHINITFRWILNHNELCPYYRRTGTNSTMCTLPTSAWSRSNLTPKEQSPNRGMTDLSENSNFTTLTWNTSEGYNQERMQSFTDDDSKMNEGTTTYDDWSSGRALP